MRDYLARLRARLAWRLIGPYVALPEDGVYVVTRMSNNGISMTVTFKAETFEMERTTSVPSFAELEGLTSFEYRPVRHGGTFSGTFG